MNKIRDNLYLSGQDIVHDAGKLRDAGITAILNVADNCNDPLYARFEFLMIKIGLSDDPKNPPFMKELAISTLENLINNGHKVLVHCIAGASRSPYIVGRYLERKEGKENQVVMAELHSLRPEVFERSPLHDE